MFRDPCTRLSGFGRLLYFVTMKRNVYLLIALLPGASLYAQEQKPPAAPQVLKEETYVRRFSAGATLSVLVLDTIPAAGASVITSSPAFDGQYSTKNASKRIGFGVTAQAAITERFAVNASVLLRKMGYKRNSDIYTGVDNPSTPKDERTYTVHNEDTRAKFRDVPVTLRYYTKDRHMSGPRGFVEGGAALRWVSHIRTSIDTTVNAGDTKCCDTTPVKPDSRTVRGLVAGAGFQLIDGVGIRVVPAVRYTRWMGDTFNTPSTRTQRNQVEGMVSLTF